MNPRALLKRYFHKAKTFLTELNLFSTNEEKSFYEIYNQILSTRIYIILLILTTSTLLIYTAISSITETVIVKQPTYDQYKKLISQKFDPECQCKQISIIFNKFIDLQPHYHPICSSDFISNKWIDYLNNLTLLHNIYYSDFRRTAVYSFQFLRSLCQLTETTVNKILKQQLQLKSYITYQVKTDEIFQEEIHSFIDALINTEETNFVQLFTIFRSLTISQNLISTLTTNALLYVPTSELIPYEEIEVYFQLRTYYNRKSQKLCECRFSTCYEEYEIKPIYNDTNFFIVPDFYTGCFIVDSLLYSSLICFYNQSCIDQLLFHLNSSLVNTKINLKSIPKPLNKTNQTVEELISHLMVNKWNKTIYFDKYYQLCEPLQCTYTYNHRFVFNYIFTTLWAIIGGLVTVLRVLVPKFVQIIRNKRKRDYANIRIRLWLVEKLKSINLFKPDPPTTDYEILRPQIISTHIYLITFLISLIILIIYTAILPQKITITIHSPSIEQYEDLKLQHSDTLICKCSQISTKLITFIQLSPGYHQVCSSLYITDAWRRYLFSYIESLPPDNPHPFRQDFRLYTGQNFFNLLDLFCKMTDEIIRNRLKLFQSTDYITKTVVDKQDFLEQQNRSIESFKTVVHNVFGLSLDTFMKIIEWNALYTWSRTFYSVEVTLSPSLAVIALPIIYSGPCICLASNIPCFDNTYLLYREHNGTSIVIEGLWRIPDIYYGCFPLSGAMRSNLDCLYHELCLSKLIKYLQPAYKMNISLLEKHSATSIFNSQTEILDIIDQLMVEQWQENISYELYYAQCNPQQCTYTQKQQFIISYIITAILGIIGGLSLALRIIIPNLVQLVSKVFIRITNGKDPDDQYEDRINYENLSSQYSLNVLSCPCTIISNKYSNFLSVKPKSIHPACYSYLFHPTWIGLDISFEDMPIEDNLQTILVFYLKLANFLCVFSQSFAAREVEQFLATLYTTSFLTDKEQFENYFNLQINHFQQTLPSELRRLIEVISVTISANSLMSVAETNYQWNFVYSTSDEIFLRQIFPILKLQTKTKYYQNQTCSCQIRSKLCKEQLHWPNTNIPMPGMYLSCYFIDGLIQSTLECLYNITCLHLLKVYMSSEYNLTELLLESPTSSSLYQSNSTVQQLIDVLFVEEWFSNVSYKSYYDKCQPRECHYTFIKRFKLVYIITTTISILSGLVKVLQVLIPVIIKILYKFFRYIKQKNFIRQVRSKNRITPVVPSLST